MKLKEMEKTTLSVQKLSAQMGINLPKAYELVRQPNFPTIRVGVRILIPVENKDWLLRNLNSFMPLDKPVCKNGILVMPYRNPVEHSTLKKELKNIDKSIVYLPWQEPW